MRTCWAHDSTAGRLADAVAELSDTLDLIDAENPWPTCCECGADMTEDAPRGRLYCPTGCGTGCDQRGDTGRDPLTTPAGVIASALADRGATFADLLDDA